ncbi:RusA-like crossover junction endodeoxyribonuclease [Vibrio phage 1.224.A._10N.261.48.B1]|uniref:RusA-like crossover junction endodeoxyribonuclease n=1 Tax=Vibrio phage 1.224.A._10N.261.48.B1 TaxID=1881226 RepID=A0A2I7RS12_9CAUD|nr:RusA-like crossover junction endodeoxyribonuclease [Vibrio phage 1.224.A._10N.261.48.B1]AUR96424.1 RusA-like crossover junction endodeoxyribonuclease [Vibrio phage 1.224.A._10N.261.48.B1]
MNWLAMTTFKIRVPTHIILGVNRKTQKPNKIALNVNQYRNLHFQILNNLKKTFASVIEPQLKRKCPVFTERIAIKYELHWHNNSRVDLGNVCSIVDKFFSDCLVNSGRIADDDIKHLPKIFFDVGSIGKVNKPYVVVYVKQLKRK